MQKSYRLNQYILAPKVRLIDKEGKQIGIVSREEALKRAQEGGIDLVEIARKANPPVCRLIDFKKFKYLEAKKEKKTKRGTDKGGIKEIRMGPFINSHDLNVRLQRAKGFLEEKNRVKIAIKFSGRQITHSKFGEELLNKFMENFKELAKIEREPHFEGKLLVCVLAPAKKGKNA